MLRVDEELLYHPNVVSVRRGTSFAVVVDPDQLIRPPSQIQYLSYFVPLCPLQSGISELFCEVNCQSRRRVVLKSHLLLTQPCRRVGRKQHHHRMRANEIEKLIFTFVIYRHFHYHIPHTPTRKTVGE